MEIILWIKNKQKLRSSSNQLEAIKLQKWDTKCVNKHHNFNNRTKSYTSYKNNKKYYVQNVCYSLQLILHHIQYIGHLGFGLYDTSRERRCKCRQSKKFVYVEITLTSKKKSKSTWDDGIVSYVMMKSRLDLDQQGFNAQNWKVEGNTWLYRKIYIWRVV